MFKHNNLEILFSTNIVVYALTFCFYLRYIESNVLISLWHWLVVWPATSNTIINMAFNHVGQIRKYSSLCQKNLRTKEECIGANDVIYSCLYETFDAERSRKKGNLFFVCHDQILYRLFDIVYVIRNMALFVFKMPYNYYYYWWLWFKAKK